MSFAPRTKKNAKLTAQIPALDHLADADGEGEGLAALDGAIKHASIGKASSVVGGHVGAGAGGLAAALLQDLLDDAAYGGGAQRVRTNGVLC